MVCVCSCGLEVYSKLLLPISRFLIKPAIELKIYALDYSLFRNRTHSQSDAGYKSGGPYGEDWVPVAA